MHLYLIGYRGSGKSTVGRLLAARLDSPFVDTDDLIESLSGRSIREIFAQDGEAGFRDIEQHAVRQASERAGATVIALGGGAILRQTNRDCIQRTGRRVWLKGSPQHLFARIELDSSTAQRRPQLRTGGGYNEVVELLAARESIYEQLAQLTVLTDDRMPDDITEEIVAWVNENG